MRIAPLTELPDAGRIAAAAERIFWDNAHTGRFASAAERAAYRELWFARYVRHCPAAFFLALDAAGATAGYLAGSVVSNAPPMPGPDYYALLPPALLEAYPGHLHVNVRAERRGRGIGAALVAAFLDHGRSGGLAGAHAVTAAGSPAARFFERCGLAPAAEIGWRGRRLAFLAAKLSAP
jgi:GNAT superfamily N-acetyltransferase